MDPAGSVGLAADVNRFIGSGFVRPMLGDALRLRRELLSNICRFGQRSKR